MRRCAYVVSLALQGREKWNEGTSDTRTDAATADATATCYLFRLTSRARGCVMLL